MTHCSKVFTKLDKDRDSRINSNVSSHALYCLKGPHARMHLLCPVPCSLQELVVGIIEVLHNCITADQARSTLEVCTQHS